MNHFKCTNHKCVDNSYVCDGRNDCGDYSDEDKGCQGKRAYFKSFFYYGWYLFFSFFASLLELPPLYLGLLVKIELIMK